MRKSIIIAVLLAVLSTAFESNAQQKIRLTDEQIATRIPAGIIRTRPAAALASSPSLVEMPQLVEGWVNPTYSPDYSKIAYTLGNNLYSIDVNTREIVQHTSDGSDVILNGYASWVYYEEIFGRASRYKAFWWSPDSKILAFYRFDNTKVPMFPIYNSEGQHGSINETRYPKAGDPNPEVKIGFVSVRGGETVWADFDSSKDQYFGIPFWNPEGTRFMVSWMDRSQDNLRMYSVDPVYGNKYQVYSEQQATWIDWMEQMLFTDKGMYIVRDTNLWQQIYFLSYDGKVYKRITDGGENWGIRLLRVDRRYLYYTAKRESTVRNDIYRITLSNNKVERISSGGYNFASVRVEEEGGTKIYASMSNLSTPTKEVVFNIPRDGSLRRMKMDVLFDSKGPDFDKFEIAVPELVYITTRDGIDLPATVIWPIDMDRSGRVKYPVKVNIYGGPDNPQVLDSWKGVSFNNQWWAYHGVIQVVLDTRSAGHLGKAGMNQVYRRLSVLELQDFIDGISYFRKYPFVNSQKVGIEGFSYGGTMSLLCCTAANEYFQYAIAGGAVADWKLYDTHYTERYMDTPQDNPSGYAQAAVFDRMGAYRGDKTNMLRYTHGTGDDNVHFQNGLQIIDKLQQLGKDFELMIYPQGMHGYRGYQSNQSNLQDYRFWYEYLLEQDLPDVLRKRWQ
ncbi:MAG: DPP IV N-terminal domain-containing protein [Bacteroidales bacterium]|nr:DPP IV N-terminal domain-containing protein [Bacteroidales bacterium]